jgi:hypothetical protein
VDNNTHINNELLRKAILRYITLHHPAGFTVDSLCTVLKPRGLLDFTPTPEQTHSALSLLADLGLARKIDDPLGSSEYWSATGKGVIEMERQKQ